MRKIVKKLDLETFDTEFKVEYFRSLQNQFTAFRQFPSTADL